MFDQILQYVKGSETATYALAFSTLAPLAYTAPKYIQEVLKWIWERSTYSVDIHFSDAIYVDMNRWLSQNPKALRFNRHWRLKSGKRSENYDNEEQSSLDEQWSLVPSYGSCLFKDSKSPWMIFQRSKENDKRDTILPTDILHFTGFAWHKRKIDNFFNHIQDNLAKVNSNPSIFLSDGWSWTELRKIHSVYNTDLLSEEATEVLEDIENFLASKEWYKSKHRNIKFKRGYLFSGIPGSGKSTLVQIIAKKFGMNVYYLRAKDMQSWSQSLFSSIPKHSIILIEDIDTLGLAKRELDDEDSEEKLPRNVDMVQAKAKTDLGNLLNLLDGIVGYEEAIFIATTNKADELDEALIRPGRIDVIKEFKELSYDRIERIFKSFYELDFDCRATKQFTIAHMQSTMIKHSKDYDQCAKELGIEYDFANNI